MGSCQVSYLSPSHTSLCTFLFINPEHPQNLTKQSQRYKCRLKSTEVIILNEPWLLQTPQSLFTSPISVSPANLTAIWHFLPVFWYKSETERDKENILQYPAVCLVLQIYLAKELTYIFLHCELFSYKLIIFPPLFLISFLHFYSLVYYKEPSSYFLCKGRFLEQLYQNVLTTSPNFFSQLTWLWQWGGGKAQCWDTKGERKPKAATPNAWWKKSRLINY